MSLVHQAWMSQLTASEPWPDCAEIYKPLQEQVLIGENAAALAVQAYLRMCQLEVKVVTKENAELMSPSGKLPLLRCGKFVVSEPLPIFHFIKQKGICLSNHLSEKEQNDLEAYSELINNILVPAEMWVSWAHEEIRNQITNKRYGYPYPWPLNKILCWTKKRDVLAFLDCVGWGKGHRSMTLVEDEVKRCCLALSQKLSKKPYFFGDQPTELDALVFGHLYTLITTKLPDNRLAETVRSFDNLTEFCKNIDQKYFNWEIDQLRRCSARPNHKNFNRKQYYAVEEVAAQTDVSVYPNKSELDVDLQYFIDSPQAII